MKYDCPDCGNNKCSRFNYGYANNCENTSWASDPSVCKSYIAVNPQPQPNNEVKPLAPTCPLCSGEVKKYLGKCNWHKGIIVYDTIEFECCNKECAVNMQFDGITLAEALARFSTRPESRKEKAFDEIVRIINEEDAYEADINYYMLKEFVHQIEKELKGE